MFAVLIFLISIIIANLLVQWQGPWITPINAFIFIGLDLSLRDYIHEKWNGRNLKLKMFALICGGATITYLLNQNAGMICVASVIAFASAMIVDTFIYQKLLNRSRVIKMNVSNIGSALTDSILFPSIAFGIFMPWIIFFQFLAKVFGGAVWVFVLEHIRRNKNERKKFL